MIRRRIDIELTERGRAAAAEVRDGVEAVDAELAAEISPAELAGLRAGRAALTLIRERSEERMRAAGRSRPVARSAAGSLDAPESGYGRGRSYDKELWER